MLACVAARGHLQQSIQVFTLESNNTDRVEIAKLALAHAERGGGDFNWIVRRPLAAAKRFQNPTGFLTAAASHLGYQYRGREFRNNFAGMFPQQTLVGAGDAVLRQGANYFKESRADGVVEIFRGQLFLADFRQASANVLCKFGYNSGGDGVGEHEV